MASLGEIMTKDVYTTTGETPVVAAAQAMVKGRFGSAFRPRRSPGSGRRDLHRAGRVARGGVRQRPLGDTGL